jgi:3-isopropylmalate dehydrogenase
MAEALKAARLAASIFGFGLKERILPFGAGYYLERGEVLPKGALDDIGGASALLLGAVGDPAVPPGPLERELLLALRFHFDQYLNLRPAVSLPGVPLPTPLPPGAVIDALVVRENTEDFYMGLGSRLAPGPYRGPVEAVRGLYRLAGEVALTIDPPLEAAFSLGVLTAPAVKRVAAKAFELARTRGESLVHVATKANALPAFYGFWDEMVKREAANHQGVKLAMINVDNLCYQLPRAPRDFGVILCPNLFGDIVSDLLSALAGGLGLAASANVGDSLCMFEPVHGSAPDIKGTGRANPLAAILSAAMCLEHLGEGRAAAAVRAAVAEVLASGDKPIELGGTADCRRVGDLTAEALKRAAGRP